VAAAFATSVTAGDDMLGAFVIRPFGLKKDSSGKTLDFDRVEDELIGPALAQIGVSGHTAGEIVEAGNIREDMFASLIAADIVVCDITIHNATVFYELGLRHALRKKRTILIRGNRTAEGTPFDLLTDRYHSYDIHNPGDSVQGLASAIKAALVSDRTDSPIFQLAPKLPEAASPAVPMVPLDFLEEIERARASKQSGRGWLRLLAKDVRGRHFEQEGLRRIAKEQWELGDYEGACTSWEWVSYRQPDDIEANLALANLYERQARRANDPELLLKSDRAIECVLANDLAALDERAEALSLKARNSKRRWISQIEGKPTLPERRRAAMNKALRDSYELYRESFYHDLNKYYSGDAALEMGTVLLDLLAGDEDGWKQMFDDDEAADTYRRTLVKNVEALREIVPAALSGALSRMAPSHPERLWAEVVKAEVSFLTA
jgi:hypothetical protein